MSAARCENEAADLRLCVVHLDRDAVTQTFARAHAERLPCRVSVIHGRGERPLWLDDVPLAPASAAARALRTGRRTLLRAGGRSAVAALGTPEYTAALRLSRPDVVLAEFGPSGVQVMEACSRLGIPLVVHFHGYDATVRDVLAYHARSYRRLFASAAAVVAPSEALRERLVALGAPGERTYTCPNGADVARFVPGDPGRAPPVFVTVGRLVEKKGTCTAIAAFAHLSRKHPEARLRIVGDGPLQSTCEALADTLCPGTVTFLGNRTHDEVAAEMRAARALVHHSVVAADGDTEGMPVAVIEAGAAGLPVVATRHSGIPEVVVDSATGFLVEERDVAATAGRLELLAADPGLAGRLGRAARRRVEASFTLEHSIQRLWAVVLAAAGRARL